MEWGINASEKTGIPLFIIKEKNMKKSDIFFDTEYI